ncbi:alpha/beta fold hydrolase [Streptomyces fuscichromogenes]|uniref:4,5-9,10-diseco-3-hydroxy-5,9, 17-trioxoandrosta-1(10),2-diene-4-oate hydrolase n=1 Tax=Streptomyces fuscichromogenes TaxID=1324013 RepID=A0A918CWR5_9ACTN|nr:alpha/beta hydrolase [Streptomyces fuscichromogenes]GGN40282.1 4,5-9,10-diseco-3-hydroxy-5,9,17-trioxoandrosta-1(10),2-diene-4-oate hydrolase [Streptomyces fuscichromogenes]
MALTADPEVSEARDDGTSVTAPETLLIAPADLRRTISTSEGVVHWTELGEGTPLLFIQPWGPHPGVTAWMAFAEVAQELSDRYRCILLDLPNYGLSGPVEYHEPVHDVAVRAVIRLLDELELDRVVVVGGSMGGTTALDLALTHPDRVSALFVGSCHASTGGDPYLLAPFPPEAISYYLASVEDPASEFHLRRFLGSLVHQHELLTEELVSQMISFRERSAAHIEAEAASATVAHSNLGDLHRITCPTVIFHGRIDRMVPLEQALMLAAYIRHADLVVFGECGHWPSFERPHQFAIQLSTFLKALNHSGHPDTTTQENAG